MYIIRHYPLSAAYPLVSLSFAFGMIAAIIFFHEHVDLTKWIGLILIVAGCYLISK
jgi:undecaprenyl phosphate-alpha-L-ara4N flippase subunit ArnE